MSRWLLISIAVAIGVGVVAVQNILFSLLTGNSLAFSADVEPVQATVAAIPYLALALAGVRRRKPWLVGLVLTLSLWGSVLYGGVSYQWNPDGSGADILSGLLMLASPFLFTPILLAVAAVERKAPANR